MAILTGINTRLRGSAGDWTFSQLNGQTVAKQKMQAKENPKRTFAQMIRRVQWANLVALYRSFDGNLHPSFENRDSRVSDYNEFMSANSGAAPVYLTKDQARQGGCVVAAYQVTRGSLPSIVMTEDASHVVSTDINLGSLTIGSGTDIKAFSDAVVQNNPNYRYGDQISCFIATQSMDAATNVPRVSIEALEITLDGVDDETMLYDVVNAHGFSTVGGHLGADAAVTGAIAWIHSRRSSSGTKVSTQRFMVNNSILSGFQTADARDKAILSYGGTLTEQFLTPNDTEAPQVNP